MAIAEPSLKHGGPYAWGPKRTLQGLGVASGIYVLTNIAFAVLLIAFDRGFRLEDAGTFEKAADVVSYAGERLSALRAGAEVPDTPELFADVEGLKLGFLTTFVLHIGVIGAVLWATRQTPSKLAQAFRLDDYSFTDLWLPGLVTIGAYGGVIGYSILAEVVDIDLLRPQSTVPDAVTRDKVALALAGVLAVGTAPIAEEVFFRGFIFSGLRKYGFFVAASVSGVLFTLAHLDPGSVIPFFLVGVALAWLYWYKGRLWDAIACHFMFNTISFLLLLGTS